MLPRDPDLDPVPAARAHLEAQARRPAASQAAGVPRIEPAEPARWLGEVALQFPLVVDGERLDRLTLRRITAGDLARLVIDLDDDASLDLRARALVCGVHPAVIEALAADDAIAVAEAARPFLPAVLARTGDTTGVDAGA